MERSGIEASTQDGGAAEDAVPDAASWSPLHKLFFRFACIYFLWYALPDFAAGHTTFLSQYMDRMAAWIGESLLGMGEISIKPTGSGDTTVHYR